MAGPADTRAIPRLAPDGYRTGRVLAAERTGWPSFWQPLDRAVETQSDSGILGIRTEVHCRRCGGHLGHVFEDGPQPTGLRYCMNGVAMSFIPASRSAQIPAKEFAKLFEKFWPPAQAAVLDACTPENPSRRTGRGRQAPKAPLLLPQFARGSLCPRPN